MEAICTPTLILCGDEDEACVEPSLFMKRHIPGSGLAFFPKSGHGINLEEPDLYNRFCLDFLTAVEQARWWRGWQPVGLSSGVPARDKSGIDSRMRWVAADENLSRD